MEPAWINRRVRVRSDVLFPDEADGIVVAVNAGALAVALSMPMGLPTGEKARHMVASLRHEPSTIEEIFEGVAVLCNLILVPDGRFDVGNPLDVGWWRGGGADIGEVRGLESPRP